DVGWPGPGAAGADGAAVERADAVRAGRRAGLPAGAGRRLAATPSPAPMGCRAGDDRSDGAGAARAGADPGSGAAARDRRPVGRMARADHAPERKRGAAPARMVRLDHLVRLARAHRTADLARESTGHAGC